MARQVKPEEHAAKRTQILTAALELIHQKGFQQMTIADVLDAVGISKGAFYHYFDSKGALLDGVIDAMRADVADVLEPVAADTTTDALTKLRTYIVSAVDWKVAHRSDLSAIARMWRNEHNTLLRQRITDASIGAQGPLIAAIIRQGCAEGVFDATYPDQAATIIAGMGMHLGDALLDAFTGAVDDPVIRDRREVLLRAHLEALERILGAAPGSFAGVLATMVDMPTLPG
ncbi:TetR/AcrR family transcriptional regulator [Nocardia wallacei]|uniref:TetR/AcrR family transcriptional regulator n=1 Tax=Nocardia wallacei TaxID=480035 RepID=UPI00245723D1|nr:TetR/AcrR family transcriptional regulator [Nocardia wallacei]